MVTPLKTTLVFRTEGTLMIRLSLALCMLALVSLSTNVNAAEPADSGVSQSALAAMGLGGMRTMDREESSVVRGQGAITFGLSYSRTTIRGRRGFSATGGSVNGYYNNFNNFSGGFSFAGSNAVGTPFIYGTGFSLGGGF